jgi:hypothetical protein
MKVIAQRGVCIGPGRYLALGEAAELDAPTARFLVSIGAVAPAPADAEPQPTPSVQAPARPAKKES